MLFENLNFETGFGPRKNMGKIYILFYNMKYNCIDRSYKSISLQDNFPNVHTFYFTKWMSFYSIL